MNSYDPPWEVSEPDDPVFEATEFIKRNKDSTNIEVLTAIDIMEAFLSELE